MSIDQFKDSVSAFSPWLVYLQLFFQGEPFIHPHIYDFIKIITKHNIYSSISTNGHFLNKKNCQKIVDSGLKRLIISLDGTTQKSYEKYRVGGSLDLVLEGIKNMVETKKNSKITYPTIIVQFVVFKSNENELGAIKKLCKQLKVDALQLKTAQIDNFTNGHPLIPENNKYSRYQKQENGTYTLKREGPFRCKRIAMGSVIAANGDMLPCCFDKDANHSYAISKKASLKVWKNKDAQIFRKKVWHNPDQFEMCRNCTEGLKL